MKKLIENEKNLDSDRTEASWSLLSPNPIIVYLEPLDEYIVYWDGFVATYLQALMAVMYLHYGCTITPKMLQSLDDTFTKVYEAKGFGNINFSGFQGSMTKFVINRLSRVISQFKKNLVPSDIFKIFDKANAVRRSVL